MSDDIKNDAPGAKPDQTTPTSEGFNKNNYLEEKIANLSVEAKAQARLIQKVGYRSRERMQASQVKNHERRVRERKAELVENYIKEQALRPNKVRKNPTQDLMIIAEQAEKQVTAKEKWYLQNIDRATNANVREIIAMEKEGQNQGHSDRNPEQER